MARTTSARLNRVRQQQIRRLPKGFRHPDQGVGYDVSRGIATNNTIAAIKQAQDDPTYEHGDGIYVVGYSQGANAQSDVCDHSKSATTKPSTATEIRPMTSTSATSHSSCWAMGLAMTAACGHACLQGSTCRSSGWISARQPTRSTGANDPNAPKVLLITKQYDGAADWPKYVLINPPSAVNAAMGFMYVHNGYYKDVDIKRHRYGR